MTQTSSTSHADRARGVTFFAIANAVSFVLTLLFWGAVFFRKLIPFPGDLVSLAERGNAAVTYGFMLGDVLYSAPLLLFGCIGLWRLRSWGWLATQMANALWIYSMTVILFRDAYTTMSPGGVIFIPFTLIAIWAIPYLWRRRSDFGITR
jgi:hypothetical protein